jgi:serine/threonine-protein kinase RsbT
VSNESCGIVAIRTEQDVVSARQLVRKLTIQIGFSLVDQTKMVTAASELARNTFVYGGGGEMQWSLRAENGKSALELVFSDKGPGIADMSLAMKDGWTSGNGLGLGLSGAKRLVSDFEINSEVGKGTQVKIVRWK